MKDYYIKIPKLSKKAVITIVSTAVAFAVILTLSIFAIVHASLEATKNTEEYKLAYEYLIQSEKFEGLGLIEDDLRFNSYNKSTTTNADGEKVTAAELGFRIGFTRSIYVICHDNGEGWYVCEECTKFE